MYEDFDDQFKDIHPLVDANTRKNTFLMIKSEISKYFKSNFDKVEEIKEQGYTNLGQLLSNKEIEDIKIYLKDKLCYDSHVIPGSSGLNTIENIRIRKASACYSLYDVLTCPHILELALSRDILNIAEFYLECVPTLYSINIFHSFKEHNIIEGIKSFHRDADDIKFLCLFVYLVNVDKDNGPTIFIKYTHNEEKFIKYNKKDLVNIIFPPNMMTGHGNDTLFNLELSNNIDVLIGPAGTGFFADTFAIHRASNLSKDRLILWMRFGTHHNGPARDQIIKPLSKNVVSDRIKTNKKLNFITRLLISDA